MQLHAEMRLLTADEGQGSSMCWLPPCRSSPSAAFSSQGGQPFQPPSRCDAPHEHAQPAHMPLKLPVTGAFPSDRMCRPSHQPLGSRSGSRRRWGRRRRQEGGGGPLCRHGTLHHRAPAAGPHNEACAACCLATNTQQPLSSVLADRFGSPCSLNVLKLRKLADRERYGASRKCMQVRLQIQLQTCLASH